jgi:hypothetical protein
MATQSADEAHDTDSSSVAVDGDTDDQTAPPSVEASTTPSPTAKQSVAEAQETLLRNCPGTGRLPADQTAPPSVVNRTPSGPTAAQSAVEPQETPVR